jgi:RNA-directed DNA polymerase
MVSSQIFGSLGHYTWQLTYKWARWTHPKKGARWVTSRYYGKFCPSRNDKWVFGNRDTGAYLLRHSWTSIRRHVMVKGWASPDDPDLAGYWENRRRRNGPPLDAGTLSLLGRQQNRCPSCGDLLIDATHLPASPEGGKTGGSASPARTPSAQPARRKSPCRRRQAGPSLS